MMDKEGRARRQGGVKACEGRPQETPAPPAATAPLTAAQIRADVRATAAAQLQPAGSKPERIFVPRYRRDVLVVPGAGVTRAAVLAEIGGYDPGAGPTQLEAGLIMYAAAMKFTVRLPGPSEDVPIGELLYDGLSIDEIACAGTDVLLLLGRPAMDAAGIGAVDPKASRRAS